ncbi:MAG: DUF4038 domain-containing protein [Candidatus Hydrogenedentes bacterium]|nr:DUF4038 domain-containing protein [Candidatus Hydrogenedentota bacterium]
MNSPVSTAVEHVLSQTLLLLAVLLVASAASADTVAAWTRWEHRFVSDRVYANPCVDVEVRVRFEGPGGEIRSGMAFWDGGSTYVVRHAFPLPGEWRWSAECSDSSNGGLQQTGVVRVQPARGRNPLARHGYPRVSDDGRTLVFADGTPFLWVGDTCWAAPVHATSEEWDEYLNSRTKKGYTVLQMSIAPEWALKRSRKGIPPFLSALPDITQPNPAFFQELDRMLDEANDRGLAVTLCGLMETPYEYPPAGEIAVFSRYVAARYGSHAVMFSPSFDSGVHEAETLASATSIRAASPASLVTMHMGTGVGPHFHAANWLAFDMYQSGHNGGDAARQSARAVGMPAEILALAPRKPIINGEAIYEGELGGAYGVRRTAWLSFLSGAMGYTAGIDAVYAWEPDVMTMMNAPSNDQIAVLAAFLRALPWWSLDPEPGRILNQPDDRARLMAFAMSEDRGLGIAYLPANESIALNLNACSPTYDTFWIHACTGRVIDGPRLDSTENAVLAAPGPEDWALLLTTPKTTFIAHVREALRRLEFEKRQTAASITFREDAPLDGLVRKTPGDGAFVYATREGVRCIVNDNPARNAYLYLDLDDRLAFRGGLQSMMVRVKLHSDTPLDGVQLQYDAVGSPGKENVYRGVAPSRQSQENGWTQIEFTAEMPYCGNRQNSGADFRVHLAGHRCHIASAEVSAEAE